MEGSPHTRRVAIAVDPRLLADTLSCALARDGVEIVNCADGSAALGSFDLAVVTSDRPPGLSAHVVVVLPAADGDGLGSVTTPHGTKPTRLDDLATVLETLHRFIG